MRKHTLINAVIGAVVAVVLSFIPFSTVLGGGVSGYLEGPNGRDGTIAGAIAGAITFLPVLGIGFVVVALLGVGVSSGGAPLSGTLALLIGGFVLVLSLLYTVGLSALGGYLGSYLATEYPEKRRDVRETIGMREDTEPTDSAPGRDRYT